MGLFSVVLMVFVRQTTAMIPMNLLDARTTRYEVAPGHLIVHALCFHVLEFA